MAPGTARSTAPRIVSTIRPRGALVKQYMALMETEGIELTFLQDAIHRIAEFATIVNERTENIGARRLHTMMERLLEVVSFDAAERKGENLLIDGKYVDEHLGELAKDEDLSRYIL